MSKTLDMGTPIFGALNEELGELPEITVHDFDVHAFDFLRAEEAKAAAQAPSASDAERAEAAEGGRRRKED